MLVCWYGAVLIRPVVSSGWGGGGCFDWSVVGWLVVGLYTDLIRPVGESSERAQEREVAQGGNTSISSPTNRQT